MCAKNIRREAEDPVTDPEGRDPLTKGIHDAREIHPKRPHLRSEQPGHRTREKRMPAQHGCIRSADGRRMNFQPKLARRGLRNRHPADRLDPGRAIAVDDHGLHTFAAFHPASVAEFAPIADRIRAIPPPFLISVNALARDTAQVSLSTPQ